MREQGARGQFWRWSNPVAWGIGLSVLMAVLVLVLSFVRGKDGVPLYLEFQDLSPNEIGDTLAGVFTGLAFIWIVVSTFIQRAELYSTVLELKEATRIARERSSLREFELLVSRIEEAFSTMAREDAMYGEWAFRISGQDHLEHGFLRGRRPVDPLDIRGSISKISATVEKTYGFLKNPNAVAEQRPKRRQEHLQLVTAVGQLADIASDFPRYEARLLEEWKLATTAKLLKEIWDTDSFWKLDTVA